MLRMKKTEIKKTISQKHRVAIKRFMTEHDLNVGEWSKRAGLTEGALRNFLNGINDSMGANNLQLLADAEGVTVGKILGEDNSSSIDDDLMLRSLQSIEKAALIERKKLNTAQMMAFSVSLYKHIIKYRKDGEKIEPNQALAALVLKQQAQ